VKRTDIEGCLVLILLKLFLISAPGVGAEDFDCQVFRSDRPFDLFAFAAELAEPEPASSQDIFDERAAPTETEEWSGTMLQQVRELSPVGGVTRSFVFPGLGQLYYGQRGRGSVFLGLALGCLAYAVVSICNGEKAYRAYQKTANSGDIRHFRRRVEIFGRQRNQALMGFGVVWTISLVDVLHTFRKSN
jgi:hypothetical protein